MSNTMRYLAFIAILLITITCVLGGVSPAPEAEMERLFDAIRSVETGGHPDPRNATGDNGRSLGPYQIGRPYWKDSRVPGTYEQVREDAYARRVMLAYWNRYCPEALATLDMETLSRIHNGGPRGHRKAATKPYWNRVRAALESQP